MGAIVSSYIEGMSLEDDSDSIQADAIGCAWSTPQDAISSLTDIKTFSVDIEEGPPEVVSVADSQKMGFTGFFNDPRLDAIGGVGLFQDGDTAVVGAGVGRVDVPGVSITVSSSKWGQDGNLDKDGLVTLALQLLDM